MKLLPKYFPIVFAFAGDSTMTRDFAIPIYFLTYIPLLVSISGQPVKAHEKIATLLPHLHKLLTGQLANQAIHFQFKEGADQLR